MDPTATKHRREHKIVVHQGIGNFNVHKSRVAEAARPWWARTTLRNGIRGELRARDMRPSYARMRHAIKSF